MQKDELAGIAKIKIKSLIELLSDKSAPLENVEYLTFGDSGNQELTDTFIKKMDIIPSEYDNFYLKTAYVIQLIIKGVSVVNPYNLSIEEIMEY